MLPVSSPQEAAVYVNVTRVQVQPGVDLQELAQRSSRELAPLFRQLAGFQSYYDVKVADDTILSITIWDSQTDFENGLKQLVPWMTQNVAPFFAGAPDRIGGEVLSQSEG